MPDRSMPEVPDLNAQDRAERAMHDLTWGPGRTMPTTPQYTQSSYVDMQDQMDRAHAEWDRMRDCMLYQQEPVQAPQVGMPFRPPESVGDYPQQRHESNDEEAVLIGMAIAAAIVALTPAARRVAVKFRGLPAKRKMFVVLAAAAILALVVFRLCTLSS